MNELNGKYPTDRDGESGRIGRLFCLLLEKITCLMFDCVPILISYVCTSCFNQLIVLHIAPKMKNLAFQVKDAYFCCNLNCASLSLFFKKKKL